jgi:hypothetical protein
MLVGLWHTEYDSAEIEALIIDSRVPDVPSRMRGSQHEYCGK